MNHEASDRIIWPPIARQPLPPVFGAVAADVRADGPCVVFAFTCRGGKTFEFILDDEKARALVNRTALLLDGIVISAAAHWERVRELEEQLTNLVAAHQQIRARIAALATDAR